MSRKDQYRYRIMKTYGILVDYEGEAELVNVPAPNGEDETFNRWKLRVLGPNVSEVTVMTPEEPDPRQKMKYITVLSSSDSVESMFRERQQVAKVAKSEAVADTRQRYATYPKENLQDILADRDLKLEDSVKQYLNHLIEAISEKIDQDALIRKLVLAYNMAVRTARETALTNNVSR
jgi:hypothetical protein